VKKAKRENKRERKKNNEGNEDKVKTRERV
jgi:hypothetical protein